MLDFYERAVMQQSSIFPVREVTKNNPPIIALNFDSYSRRGNRCILKHSRIAATKNRGQRVSKMSGLFFVIFLRLIDPSKWALPCVRWQHAKLSSVVSKK